METILWITLSLLPQVGARTLIKLLQKYQTPENILQNREFLPEKARCYLENSELKKKVEQHLAWLEKTNNGLITLADADYPTALLETHSPPVILFYKGNRQQLSYPQLAMVGTRHPSHDGKKTAYTFAKTLADHQVSIISGLANGIDTAAHQGALCGAAKTIAVVATGLDRVYPSGNHALAHQIAQEGLLLSEFPLGTPALPQRFPQRNRIISGLSKGCLVVEASLNSGSLITARLAAEEGRDVFAVPGSIYAEQSRGCHRLLREGAMLVETVEDILSTWHVSMPVLTPVDNSTTWTQLPKEAQALMQHMTSAPIAFDVLCQQLNLTAETLSAMLLTLELDGHVAALPGGFYQRRS